MPDNTPTPANVQIRPATAADLPAINSIYNHYVLHSTCTYQDEPETLENRQLWWNRHGPAHPVTVAIGETGQIIGWASLSPFHARSAYRFTVENSIYLHHDFHRRGIGGLLLADLIVRARALGYRTIIAGIDADQPGSVALHSRFNFIEVGHLRRVGYKFGKWLDVLYLQLDLPA